MPHNELTTMLWKEPATPASVLLALLVDEFGTEFFKWEPETLVLEIKDQWGVEASQMALDKIWSLVTSMTTDQFYRSPSAFTATALTLGDNKPHNFDFLEPPSVMGTAWAVVEVYLQDQPDDPKKAFTDEVKRYMGVILANEGFSKGFGVLNVAIVDPAALKESDQLMSPAEQGRAGQEIGEHIKLRLGKMLKLINSLPLKHKDSKSWSEFLDRVQSKLHIALTLEEPL